jgi:hypothetical protein
MFTVLRDEGGNLLQVPNNMFFQKMFRVSDRGKASAFECMENQRTDASSKSAPPRSS